MDGEYAYFITDSFPFIPRCLNGEFTDTKETPEGMPGETTAEAPSTDTATDTTATDATPTDGTDTATRAVTTDDATEEAATPEGVATGAATTAGMRWTAAVAGAVAAAFAFLAL